MAGLHKTVNPPYEKSHREDFSILQWYDIKPNPTRHAKRCINARTYTCSTYWNLPKCYAKSIDKVFTNISDGWYVNKYNFSVKLPQKMPVCIIA